MDFEASLTTLRTLSVMVAGLLGILGLLGNFRREDGKLNKWGYAAICFILISTVISISTTVIEANKERAEALGQLSRMEGLLKELYRVGQPITQLAITFWVELPTTNKAVGRYIAELDQAIASRKKDLQRLVPKTQGLDVAATDHNGELLTVNVSQKSPYWPKNDKKIIGDVAKTFGFTIYIRKDPIKPELFNPLISTNPGYSDWIAMDVPLNTKNEISMDYKDKTVYIFGSAEYKKRMWKTNGKITSMQDLYGSQLFLLPPRTFDYELPTKFKAIENPSMKAFIGSVKIKTIVFVFSSGREIWIDGAKFGKSIYRGGSPVFSIILPNNEKELLGLASNIS